ncbi:MAG: AbrB/MazE/SpoVT family DNA-binding domain-containing protein [Thaumarchaeota archaeon]|nr:AbrB/MazE/SpoVT family DNA-binding domain-containing protein [Nitrososphaerota archaeon]
MTIPAEIRKKYKLRKGSRVKFIETDGGSYLFQSFHWKIFLV